MPTSVIRFRIDFGEDASVGPGKIGLLEAIRTSGSLSQAARDVGLSYRKAWLLLESLNGSFQDPVTLATTGGVGGGGVELTPFGESLIAAYRALEHDLAQAAKRRLSMFDAKIAHRRTAATAKGRRPLARKKKIG